MGDRAARHGGPRRPLADGPPERPARRAAGRVRGVRRVALGGADLHLARAGPVGGRGGVPGLRRRGRPGHGVFRRLRGHPRRPLPGRREARGAVHRPALADRLGGRAAAHPGGALPLAARREVRRRRGRLRERGAARGRRQADRGAGGAGREAAAARRRRVPRLAHALVQRVDGPHPGRPRRVRAGPDRRRGPALRRRLRGDALLRAPPLGRGERRVDLRPHGHAGADRRGAAAAARDRARHRRDAPRRRGQRGAGPAPGGHGVRDDARARAAGHGGRACRPHCRLRDRRVGGRDPGARRLPRGQGDHGRAPQALPARRRLLPARPVHGGTEPPHGAGAHGAAAARLPRGGAEGRRAGAGQFPPAPADGIRARRGQGGGLAADAPRLGAARGQRLAAVRPLDRHRASGPVVLQPRRRAGLFRSAEQARPPEERPRPAGRPDRRGQERDARRDARAADGRAPAAPVRHRGRQLVRPLGRLVRVAGADGEPGGAEARQRRVAADVRRRGAPAGGGAGGARHRDARGRGAAGTRRRRRRRRGRAARHPGGARDGGHAHGDRGRGQGGRAACGGRTGA